jgi:hypothetical protein
MVGGPESESEELRTQYLVNHYELTADSQSLHSCESPAPQCRDGQDDSHSQEPIDSPVGLGAKDRLVPIPSSHRTVEGVEHHIQPERPENRRRVPRSSAKYNQGTASQCAQYSDARRRRPDLLAQMWRRVPSTLRKGCPQWCQVSCMLTADACFYALF